MTVNAVWDAAIEKFLNEYLDYSEMTAPKIGYFYLGKMTFAGMQASLLYLISNHVFESAKEIAIQIGRDTGKFVPRKYIEYFLYSK